MRIKIIAAGAIAAIALTACGAEKGGENGVTRSCSEGLAFAIWKSGYAGGLVRVPEWDEKCP